MLIRKATVLGAGVMGSQIAALLVNAGLQVKLLDVVIDEADKNKLSKAGYERIIHPKKGMLYDANMVGNLSYGNFTDDLNELSTSDLFIEAVKEDIQIKHDVWDKIAKIAKPTAILTTNTSGIPIEMIAKVLSDEDKARFIGFHFFNPPRYMKLVELIPNSQTDHGVLEQLKTFAETTLGKGVVIANDVPAFVANRTGVHAISNAMYLGEQAGLSVSEVDALTGKVIGRPMGTYQLSDLVGNDIGLFVMKGLMQDPTEHAYYKMSELLPVLYEKGALGNKVKHGFYKREGRKTLVFDPEVMNYVDKPKVELPILKELGRDLAKNMDVIFNASDSAGKFLWENLRNTFYYAAHNVPKATQDFRDIDRAMVWGFNWKLGPFQLWDLMGFEKVKDRIAQELGELPNWVQERQASFYSENEQLDNVKPISEFIAETIWNREGSNLSVTHEQQLLFKIQTTNNTLTAELSTDLIEAIDKLENEAYSSLVLYSPGANFSVGANLFMVKAAIEQGKVDEQIEPTITELHRAVNRMRYATKPIVTAVQGRALGGGAELILGSPYVVAAAESYIGLVEVGVGVIPSGGGLAELTERVMMSPGLKANHVKLMAEVVTRVSSATVAMNAYEARRHLYLRDTDTIIANSEQRVEVALKKAKFLSENNYIPRTLATFPALGEDFKAIVEGQLDAMRLGNFISDYDMELGLAIASIVSGGAVPEGVLINQLWLQNLEKEYFVKLSKNQKTYERISHMLQTGKPLRN
ncbi:3-hydroxyacyl-CoA dehydrogenase [Aerococcaceae bacterium DSM 109653]|uniref:enoyl-CoA hydratase n=1 Tax=Fundicoccus ignavus TaxID=2664442 RepID=A0A6I2GIW8_9LACT|nr:3-hydroxyacyl-CoA dehydrogenase/enoyl-CoA hydratase family protein [Fundicoccus ignavus]MRI81903.1 3-hydroxyacyl-CoA dehydrogenase [Fundicoccus ignavus]MRI85219.1 3-hydroxyacyl-CoA dehydrogenase [Fundicoccus ignavus]